MSRTTVTVDVEVDIGVVLREASKEQLIEELDARDISLRPASQPEPDLYLEALEHLRAGNTAEAELCLQRALFPKWGDPKVCWEAYQKLCTEARQQ